MCLTRRCTGPWSACGRLIVKTFPTWCGSVGRLRCSTPGAGAAIWAAAVEEDFAEQGVVAYVIELEDRLVGWIRWGAEDEPDYRHANMDIYVDPAVHGRGVCTDAVRTLARHLIVDHGHHRVVIDPAADNTAAIRCYTKVGFRPVGIMRRYERGNDRRWHDNLLMDLLADELIDEH